MDMVPVTSSNIDSVGYDPDKQTLSVLFTNGKTYTYDTVPRRVYDALLHAPSKGRYFSQMIRNQYPVVGE